MIAQRTRKIVANDGPKYSAPSPQTIKRYLGECTDAHLYRLAWVSLRPSMPPEPNRSA